MSVLVTALFIVALVLAAIEDIRSRGQSLLVWAVVCIAVGLLIGRLL